MVLENPYAPPWGCYFGLDQEYYFQFIFRELNQIKKTNNAWDMIQEIKMLFKGLNDIAPSQHCNAENLHMVYILHAIKLGEKYTMGEVLTKVQKVRNLLGILNSPTKFLYSFEEVSFPIVSQRQDDHLLLKWLNVNLPKGKSATT